MSKRIAPLALMIIAAGCSGSEGALTPSPTAPPASPSGEQTPADEGTPTQTAGGGAHQTPVGGGAPLDPPGGELPPASAATRRMTVAQLAASIPVVAGDDASGRPITWTVSYRGRSYDALDPQVLGATLGDPNYRDVTEEFAVPSTLYLKFMDDMARDVCAKMIAADRARGEGAPLTLVREAPLAAVDGPEIDANLRYLSLRFTGVHLADGDAEGTAALRALFDAAVAGSAGRDDAARAADAWEAVCVGLMLSPAFHIY